MPKELVVGIPESVLEENPEEDRLIFAQYMRQRRKGRAFFVLSVTCGTDRERRTVYLTLIETFGLEDRPQLLNPSTEGLPDMERHTAEKLLSRFRNQNPKDKWIRRVQEMLTAVERRIEIDSFSNVSVPDAVYPSQWNPEKKSSLGDRNMHSCLCHRRIADSGLQELSQLTLT